MQGMQVKHIPSSQLIHLWVFWGIYLFLDRYLGVPKLAQWCKGDGAPCGAKEREEILEGFRRLWVNRACCDVIIQTENGDSFPGKFFLFVCLE